MDGFAEWLVAWDRSTFLWVNHDLRSSFLDAVMPRISDLGLGHVQVIFILGAAMLCGILAREVHIQNLFKDLIGAVASRRAWVGPLIVAFAISGISATAIKRSTNRDRPSWFYFHEHEAGRNMDVQVRTFGRTPLKAHGFLSGHTATTFALATAITLVFRKRREKLLVVTIAWLMAFLIMFSRVYIVDHWPLDGAAGAILGITSGCLAIPFCKWWASRKVQPSLENGILAHHG